MYFRQKFSIILVTICSLFFAESNAGCPNLHLIHPCTCLKSRSVLTCEDLYNEDALNSIIQVAKSHDIVGVEFISVALRYIPGKAFEGSNIKFLSIVNSSITALSESSRAFIGLEKSLKSLKVENCPFANGWEWTHLVNLTKLEEMEIVRSDLMELSLDFLSLSELPLLNLKFLGTSIQRIPDYAFSSFKNLNRITLDKNELTEVKRSLLPRPAKKLAAISLSYNRIRFIPDDMFVEMPALKFLYLGSNPLYVMKDTIFKPIWKQLSMFFFHDTKLVCDCRLSWLTKMKNTKKFIHAECTTPVRLRGRKIASLESDELWCSMLSREPQE